MAQVVKGLSLLPLVGLDLRADLHLVSALLMVHALAAATQDVAIDTLTIAVTGLAAGAAGAARGAARWIAAES